MKAVGSTKGILIYGPYPDKRVPGKWMFQVIDVENNFDKKVLVYGLDTHALHVAVRRCIRRRLKKKKA